MNELGTNEDVINCARRDSLTGVTLILLMKHTEVKYGAKVLIHTLYRS